MKLFIPAVGYRIKLTNDWTFALFAEHRNQTMFEYAGRSYKNNWVGWGEPLKSVDVTVPAGTVLEIDRVYVRTANKTKSADEDYDSVTFKFADSKKKVRFWAKLSDVNEIEYELPADHAAGKEAAQERAKKPKKLTPDRIVELVHNAIYRYTSPHRDAKKGTPTWLNATVVAGFKRLEVEYVRLFEPYERARYDAGVAERRADLECRLATGELSLPMGLADKVKTVDDLKRFGLWSLNDEPFEPRGMTWDHDVCNKILSRFGYSGTRTFERLPDGTCCRTFRSAPPDRTRHWEKNAPSISHMWIKVHSDKDDVEITMLDSGIDNAKENS